jgi:uncharacterized OB-fold protein
MAADEDEFTMAAAAVDRLALAPRASRALLLAGAASLHTEDDLARFLGTSPPAEAADGTHRGDLAAAVHSAATAPPAMRPAVVVALERSLPDLGAVAAALVVEEGPAALVGADSPDLASLAALLARARADPSSWPGAPDLRTSATPSGTRAPDPGPPPGVPVAQGAYVPWPRYVESTAAHWGLSADRCVRCGTLTFPPRGRCRSCEAAGPFEPVPLDPDSGHVVASTRIGPGGQPTEFDDQVAARGPYGVVLVEFPAGVRGTFQVADGSPVPVPIGARVSLRMRRTYPMEGRWRYGRKAVPTGSTP